jgi:hypothetical protein
MLGYTSQVNPWFTGHWKMESFVIGTERKAQRKAVIDSAIVLCCNFKVHGEVLEKVEVLKYLGRLLVQDDEDVQAAWLQIQKAWVVWARVGQVLHAENATPQVAAKFYKAVVQSGLLYGCKTWNLTKAVLVQLEGFHVRAAYKMARKYKPRKGLFGKWKYPLTKDVLEECGLHLVEEYIQTHGTMIAMCVVDWTLYLECREGERQRGSMLHQWWWEQELGFDG